RPLHQPEKAFDIVVRLHFCFPVLHKRTQLHRQLLSRLTGLLQVVQLGYPLAEREVEERRETTGTLRDVNELLHWNAIGVRLEMLLDGHSSIEQRRVGCLQRPLHGLAFTWRVKRWD